MDFWKSSSKHQPIVEPAAKRISTPAGQRLSVILENGGIPTKTRDSHRVSARKGALSGLGEVPRESMEGDSHNSSGYSYSVWSEASEKKLTALKNHKQVTKRGGWKRLAIIIAIIIAMVIALAVGLALGLKKKSSNKNSDSDSPSVAAASNSASPNSPTNTISLSSTSTPSNFPVGSYSMVTFLDTVQTNCTSNPSTWTCFPYTIFNSDPNKALTTFNWIISSPSSGKYEISSTDNPPLISFKNEPLELLDQGQDTERYRFQLSQTKSVSPIAKLTEDNSEAKCDFEGTSLQAYLYTRMGKTYPDTSKGESSGSPSFPAWPFAVRVEQAIGGGTGIPNCYKLSNGQPGDKITEGLESQDQGSLCSCLYKNWRTPSVN
ncbi:hypothetical protein K469DRAFT_643878 [Zopfia rhizophila CBS 207.26]|uniref:Ubiquitin 3 binding protein But2 C-terminal domain-containing protein n=1 Tax=Zopfia rhizophila CBS 207.26 TaxID=1314779 RepID=A0A6A6DDZ3_9PEZI|nr:hypothetical protein K469DRAFT_643878 [Zopfia rhizophila CBS 207.26]